jgi:23S rRNA (uracil1939-C5)-methyltransferase
MGVESGAEASIGQLIDVDVVDLAFDGKAVGHLDGKVVFLNGGLPGETVRAEVVRIKARYLHGRVKQVLTPSPLRKPAPCTHFGTCGGCTWQDLSYESQLQYKRKQVVDCLERIGKFESPIVTEPIGADEQFYYRNKMEFSFHTDTEKGFVVGLHKRGAFDEIFDLEACHLESPESNAIVGALREFIKSHDIPVYDLVNHVGYVRFVIIRQAKRTGQIMVNIVTHRGDFPDAEAFVAALRKAAPAITTIVHNENGTKSNAAISEREVVLFGQGFIEEELLGKRFRIRANSFFQTNSLQAEKLFSFAAQLLDAKKTDRILDLYCGTGTIGLLLSDNVQEVVGVELVADAITAANENARLNNITNATFFHGDVKSFLLASPEEHRLFDAIIIDPPRAGLHPKAVKQLCAIKPPKLLYISCNPATFARDARTFVDSGYTMSAVTPVDMFPHTMHIEVVGLFSR